jgi:hypothetical protein
MGGAVEAGPERLRHHLLRPHASGREPLKMKPPLTPLERQSRRRLCRWSRHRGSSSTGPCSWCSEGPLRRCQPRLREPESASSYSGPSALRPRVRGS